MTANSRSMVWRLKTVGRRQVIRFLNRRYRNFPPGRVPAFLLSVCNKFCSQQLVATLGAPNVSARCPRISAKRHNRNFHEEHSKFGSVCLQESPHGLLPADNYKTWLATWDRSFELSCVAWTPTTLRHRRSLWTHKLCCCLQSERE